MWEKRVGRFDFRGGKVDVLPNMPMFRCSRLQIQRLDECPEMCEGSEADLRRMPKTTLSQAAFGIRCVKRTTSTEPESG